MTNFEDVIPSQYGINRRLRVNSVGNSFSLLLFFGGLTKF